MIARFARQTLALLTVLLLVLPHALYAQQVGSAPTLKQEELDQILAPIALYPDALVSQILS